MGKRYLVLAAKEGATVPDPYRGDKLPTTGRRVEFNTYWSRRLKEGCVVEVKTPPPEIVKEKVSRGGRK